MVSISIPILSRLSFRDYIRILITLTVLLLEGLFRFFISLIPLFIINTWRHHWSIFLSMTLPTLFMSNVDDGNDDGDDDGDDDDDGDGNGDANHGTMKWETCQDTVSMILKHDYPVEEHTVITKDGYILVLHRIPSGCRRSGSSSMKMISPTSLHTIQDDGRVGRSILFIHGCMLTSEVWVCQRPIQKSLSFVLADLGFDIWLGNCRGNKYSYKHAYMKPTEKRFWDFSLDEVAMYDIPAMIEYILELTNQTSISCIGFSQGTAVMFASLSLYKNLQRKVNNFIAMAATTIPKGLENGLVSSLIKISPELIFLFFGRSAFLPMTLFWQEIFLAKTFAKLLDLSMWFLFDWKMCNIAEKDKKYLYRHLYSYASVKQIVHWFQIMRQSRFQMYDDESVVMGGGHVCARYRLNRIETPMTLLYGQADTLLNIQLTLQDCPDDVNVIKIDHYEHLDFLWANDVDRTIIPMVVGLLTHSSARGTNSLMPSNTSCLVQKDISLSKRISE